MELAVLGVLLAVCYAGLPILVPGYQQVRRHLDGS